MLKNSLLFGFLLIFITGCGGSDDIDPVTQLAADLLLIDQYVADEGLVVEIDESGIRYVINSTGNGNFPQAGEIVRVNYEVFLLDGTFIDTSIEQTARDNDAFNEQRIYAPFQFEIGAIPRQVIEGFDIGTRLLSLGGHGTFLLPSTLAYKSTGSSTIPANAPLIFNITLVEID